MGKRCIICGKDFNGRDIRQICCSIECSNKRNNYNIRKNKQSDKYLEYIKRTALRKHELNMKKKECVVCLKVFFNSHPNTRTCSKECHNIDYCNRKRLESKGERYIQRRKEYNQRPDIKERNRQRVKRWINSNRGKEYRKKYNLLEDNKTHNREYRKKYRQTKRYKESVKLLRETKEYKDAQVKYDHSFKGKQTKREHLKKYMHTINFKMTQKKYRQTALGLTCSRRSRYNRRAMMNNIIEVFTMKEWKDKLESTNGVCSGINGICLTPNPNVGIDCLCTDHIYSVKKASEDFKRTGIKRRYTIDDIQFLCRRCNASKGDKIL